MGERLLKTLPPCQDHKAQVVSATGDDVGSLHVAKRLERESQSEGLTQFN